MTGISFLLLAVVCISASNGQIEIVRLAIKNILRPPNFKYERTMVYKAGQVVFDYMKDAANQQTEFRFTATYWNKTNIEGYFIDQINHVWNTYYQDHHYWEFLVNGRGPSTGVSHTVLHQNDVVLFNFTNS